MVMDSYLCPTSHPVSTKHFEISQKTCLGAIFHPAIAIDILHSPTPSVIPLIEISPKLHRNITESYETSPTIMKYHRTLLK